MSHVVIDPCTVRDISPDVLDDAGHLRVMPGAYYRGTSVQERALFGVRHGLYGFLTEELIEWLHTVIDGRSAIEIGAGHGGLAAALDIVATDSCLQSDPDVAAYYAALGQPPVRYGRNVEKLDAAQAVDKYRPQVVIASWVTHLYQQSRHGAGGNMFGVDEEYILDECEAYIFIGNTAVHRGKSIWSRPHEIWHPDWVFSRAVNGSPDFIAIWSMQP